MATIPKNQAHLAQLLGIAKSAVCEQAKRGMPLSSLEEAQAWRKENIDPARRKGLRNDAYRQPDQACAPNLPSSGTDTQTVTSGERLESFDSARKRAKIAEADLAEMEADLMRGQYLVKEDFQRYLFNAGRMLRDTLTNCARRISAEVSSMTTAEECEVVIDREHRAALASFAQTLRQTLKIEVDNPLNAPIQAKP